MNYLLIALLVVLLLIYWRLHDIVHAINFKGSIFDHNDYFNEGYLEIEKPIKKPVVATKARKKK